MNYFKLFVPAFLCLFNATQFFAQQTPYELNGKNYTATYEECMQFYFNLESKYECISIEEMGMTDAGIPLHVILINKGTKNNPAIWHKQKKAVILINNGIHPGEPDGIDASMMLVRDLAERIDNNEFPSNVALAIIPVYNIGGILNRSEFNRVDQNGPEAFGSRGNSQNLDLNRDFIKCDSKNAKAFTEVFHWIQPDIVLDNHVSDGADYKYIMTLASSQHNKLGGEMGRYLNDVFEPALFEGMKERNFPMIPYVNVWGWDAREGWSQFFDSPRYSSGYATLFNTFAFTAETHMLKPYPERVASTYTLMNCMIDFASKNALEIKELRAKTFLKNEQQKLFPIAWKLNENTFKEIEFEGYQYLERTSEVSGLKVKYYDRTKPYKELVKFKNEFLPSVEIDCPEAYIIPQGWWKVIELLKINNVEMSRLEQDTLIEVEAYKIENYSSSPTPYESHHLNQKVETSSHIINQQFRKGDYYIPMNQSAKRFLMETLEPKAHDSYFAWNFFDAILIQKEGFSDYAYEEYATQYLQEHPELRKELESKKQADTSFARNANAQLDFVYKNSPYYEKGHNLYPVFRLMNSLLDKKQNDASEFIQEIRNKKDE